MEEAHHARDVAAKGTCLLAEMVATPTGGGGLNITLYITECYINRQLASFTRYGPPKWTTCSIAALVNVGTLRRSAPERHGVDSGRHPVTKCRPVAPNCGQKRISFIPSPAIGGAGSHATRSIEDLPV